MALRLAFLVLTVASVVMLPSAALAHGEEIHLVWWQVFIANIFPYVVLGLVLLGLLALMASLFFGARWLFRYILPSR